MQEKSSGGEPTAAAIAGAAAAFGLCFSFLGFSDGFRVSFSFRSGLCLLFGQKIEQV
jgi:hypothetical protein